jgi:hypothetical protein
MLKWYQNKFIPYFTYIFIYIYIYYLGKLDLPDR